MRRRRQKGGKRQKIEDGYQGKDKRVGRLKA